MGKQCATCGYWNTGPAVVTSTGEEVNRLGQCRERSPGPNPSRPWPETYGKDKACGKWRTNIESPDEVDLPWVVKRSIRSNCTHLVMRPDGRWWQTTAESMEHAEQVVKEEWCETHGLPVPANIVEV